ncbi:MAG TPA: hypothetical protein VFS24_13265 [Steroidobacteraceae bacterium]|nr:hypothetical protein [Steroidobacteraceae bacterium]
MNYFKSDSDIARIGEGVAYCTLPKSEWTHAAHFAAAFWLLSTPDRDAFGEMPALIRAYNESTGVANTDSSGYHETITLASLRAARAWLAQSPAGTLCDRLNEFLASEYGRSDWLLAYWSRALLFSVEARRAWVEPDIVRLPF